ncbi:MAG TPA: bifunctional YncE family protein/alkaline phosphatase family protein, partial [Bryobacteraceae bacterium]|nr:bifunctional YncE family protein/alkaline phosphatase family protein [Bryobacteraceae bacterium]
VLFAAFILIAAALLSSSQAPPREQVGPLANDGYLLNSGWRVKPAGAQIQLDTLPMSSVLSKDGRFLIVLNGGYNPPSLSVLDTKDGREIGRTPVTDAWLGMSLSSNGKTLWVGGGSQAAVYEFSFDENGKLAPTRTFEIVKGTARSARDFIGDVAIDPANHLLYACDLYHDAIVVVNTQSGTVIDRFKTGRRPYRILFNPDGKSFYVSSWADGSVYHHQTSDGAVVQTLRLGAHPTDMVWRDRATQAEETEEGTQQPSFKARIFVSAANTNNVYSVGVSDSGDLRVVETVNVSTTPNHPLGMTPSALALSPDQSRLYVVCSDANAAAVVDVTAAHSQLLGFVPTGWYPTAARALPDGRLIVLNGKGSRSYPNPKGPNPTKRQNNLNIQYVAHIQTGSASFIPALTDESLAKYTDEVKSNSPYTDAKLDETPAGIPAAIQHVLYIVKENRSYDQVLGDIGKGESDPSLCLFKENVSPNHHKLAREFVLYDNFYVNSDVSADGHNWSTSAIANDYVAKMWPSNYAKRNPNYDFEGGEPAAYPPAGYLWTNANSAGVSMRNYGYWVENKKEAGPDGVQIDKVLDPVLAKNTNMKYRSFDLDYPDVKRAETFLDDLAQFENANKMPALMLLRLGNDHTSATTPGKIAPLSSFADNDYALGMIVEGVSRSEFWGSTAIFVLEDDAQNGPDHVDSHRSPAFLISPYTRRGTIDSNMYNTTSMLRTMELMLHLHPMTHFDAAARPMFASFSGQPSLAPYQAEKPRIALDDRNPANSSTATRSARLNFSKEDLNDDDELNDILWRAIRGTDPPAPVRSMFGR